MLGINVPEYHPSLPMIITIAIHKIYLSNLCAIMIFGMINATAQFEFSDELGECLFTFLTWSKQHASELLATSTLPCLFQ